MNKPTASDNLSLKSTDELRALVKRFMRESANDIKKLHDKLTGAQFKSVKITVKADGIPWLVTALASGKKVTVWM